MSTNLNAERSDALAGVRIITIGGGPAGLSLATAARAHGARVTVLEQAGDPRGSDPGYTNRSFNITLNDVGRLVLGTPRAWEGGATILGRASQPA